MKVIIDLNDVDEVVSFIEMACETYPDLVVDDGTTVEELTEPPETDVKYIVNGDEVTATSMLTADPDKDLTITGLPGVGAEEPEEDEPGRDKNGREWDGRIDSNPPTLTDKGEWRARRKPKTMSQDEWLKFKASVIAEHSAPLETPEERTVAAPAPSVFAQEVQDMPAVVTYDILKSKIVDAILDDDRPYFTNKTLESALASCHISSINEAKDDDVLVSKLNKILFG